MAQSNPPRRKRKRKNTLFTPLAFMLICAALILGMSVFFRVSNITVTGAKSYSPEEIIAASGVEKGDNLVFIDRGGAATKIVSKLPYVGYATVHRSLPNSITIEIRESYAVAYVAVDGELWAIDHSCKALSKTTSSQTEGLIRVIGLTADKPAVGDILTGRDAEENKLEYLAVILRELSARNMQTEITAVDMTNLADPSFDYMGRFQVKLGKNEDVDYKLDRLLSVMEALDPGDSGTLDLSIDERVHFSQG